MFFARCRSTDVNVHPAVMVRVVISSLLPFPQLSQAASWREIVQILAIPSALRSAKRAFQDRTATRTPSNKALHLTRAACRLFRPTASRAARAGELGCSAKG